MLLANTCELCLSRAMSEQSRKQMRGIWQGMSTPRHRSAWCRRVAGIGTARLTSANLRLLIDCFKFGAGRGGQTRRPSVAQ